MRPALERARFLTRRIVGFAALLAGGAIAFGLFLGSDDDATEAGPAPDERGYYLHDATLTELGADGKPRVVVRATSIEQQFLDDSVQLQQLELDYTTPQAGAWHVTADGGRMPNDRTSLELQGNVRVSGSAERAAGQAVILTDRLAYDIRSNLIRTTAPVAIRFGNYELHGRGLRVALNDGTLRLESGVNGSFTP